MVERGQATKAHTSVSTGLSKFAFTALNSVSVSAPLARKEAAWEMAASVDSAEPCRAGAGAKGAPPRSPSTEGAEDETAGGVKKN